MKKTFTKLFAALALLVFMMPSLAGWGQNYVYTMVTNLSDVSEGVYVIGALKSTSATNDFYFATTTINSGDITVTNNSKTVTAVNGVRSFDASDLPSGAKEFTFTGDNTDGFTIANGTNYLYFTANSNRKLAFATTGSTYKWKAVAKDNPLIEGGICLSHTGSQAYTISENSTAAGAIRGYANATQYRAIYLFKKEVSGGGGDPSISATDPQTLDYNAAGGSFTYTLDAQETTGTVSAAVTSGTWITLTSTTNLSSPVSFTCNNTNPTASERSATVTLTYTYGNNNIKTDDVTITQAGNPNIVDHHIEDIDAAGNYNVKGKIFAKSTNAFVIGDGTGYVYVYTSTTKNIGAYVKVAGTVTAQYNGIYEFLAASQLLMSILLKFLQKILL